MNHRRTPWCDHPAPTGRVTVPSAHYAHREICDEGLVARVEKAVKDALLTFVDIATLDFVDPWGKPASVSGGCR